MYIEKVEDGRKRRSCDGLGWQRVPCAGGQQLQSMSVHGAFACLWCQVLWVCVDCSGALLGLWHGGSESCSAATAPRWAP